MFQFLYRTVVALIICSLVACAGDSVEENPNPISQVTIDPDSNDTDGNASGDQETDTTGSQGDNQNTDVDDVSEEETEIDDIDSGTDDDADQTPIGMSASAARGQALFESSDQGCALCHGFDAQSTQFRLIDLNATEWIVSETGESLPSVEYVERTMRPSDPDSCVGQCAVDVVAYMRYLGGEENNDSNDGGTDDNNGDDDDGNDSDDGSGGGGSGETGSDDDSGEEGSDDFDADEESDDEGSGNEDETSAIPDTSVEVPSRIEAESYVRFFDSDPQNRGDSGLPGPVDTRAVPAGEDGGVFIGWTTPGEWLEYDIHTERDINANVTLRAAIFSPNGANIEVSLDGASIGVLTLETTGGTDNYQRFTLANIPLSANRNYNLRVEFLDGGTNFNYFDIAAIIPAPRSLPVDELNALESDTVASPLARLTNTEFVNSIRAIFELEADSPSINAAIPLMSAESIVQGLTSDSEAQSFTTANVNGYLAVSVAAVEDFLDGADSVEAIRDRLACEDLQIQMGRQDLDPYTSLQCFRDYARSLFVHIFGTPWVEDPQEFIDFQVDNENILSEGNIGSESVEAMRLRLEAMAIYFFLQPEFLLFVEQQIAPAQVSGNRTLSSDEIAKRLAYFLTGTIPDDDLLAAAASGTLDDATVRLQHANRLIESDAVSSQYADFFVGWLGVSTARDQVEQVDVDRLSQWLTAWFANGEPFSNFYSGSISVENIDDSESTMSLGILGSKAFVASQTNNPVPSYINRGTFVTSELLCGALPDNIPSAAFEDAGTQSETPTPLFHELKTIPCATCHLVTDNYGAMFQQFNQETSLFDTDARPYGNRFELVEIGDFSGEFSDIEDFSQALGQSQTAALCASKLIYRHALRRGIDEAGADDAEISSIFNQWVSSGDTSIKSLLRTIVASEHFITYYE